MAASIFGYAMRIASESWAMPIVATSTMTRGASKSRRMIVTLQQRAVERADDERDEHRQPERHVGTAAVSNTSRPAPTRPMPPTAKLMTLVAR